jgi:anti-sigma regulatory factor (Ser/Thr protein kinase)
MSGLAGDEAVYRRPRTADQLSAAVWVSPGRAEHVAGARRWAQAVAAAWRADAAADAGLVVSELVTNAIVHTRSGQPGGTVTVIVAGGWDAVTVHVHDLGAGGGQVPRPRPPAAEADGGRGLPIVAAVSAEWGTIPAAWCPVPGSGDPAAGTGCCTWCRLQALPDEHDQLEEDGADG